ncbi:MAG TPA: class I SAM-dependent methyltransferase [Chthoniobacterales bacterium]|nr:class I SAM-dependent methyltransferase [Chthoniobacterales bacterium]
MSFDRVARAYCWLETIVFGSALQNARTYWINEIPPPKRVLIVGEGNGRFLCELLRLYPKVEIDCIDASGRMLELARARVRRLCPDSLASVRFFHLDVLRWSPSNSYDLLVTHFVLDCFSAEQVEEIVVKLAQAARPAAVWLIADFTIPRRRFARMHAQFWLQIMYAFFRASAAIPAKKLVDPSPYLQNNGFVCWFRKLSRYGMLKSELYLAQNPETERPITGVRNSLRPRKVASKAIE